MRLFLCVVVMTSLLWVQASCSSSECSKKSDCTRSRKCVKGKCEQNCTSDKECLNGEKCQLSTGNCYKACSSDKECLNGQTCQLSTGNCVAVAEENSETGGKTDGGTNPETVVETPPQTCGNGKLDTGETCDKTDFGKKTCADFGFAKGSLSCKSCQIDSTGCSEKTSKCGNGFIEPGEDCEVGKLKGQECFTKGFTGGKLKCTQCKFDTSACTGGTAGTKTFGQLCNKDDDCKSGICTKFNPIHPKGYCNAVCSAGQKCPSDAQCVFQVGSKQLCGWACAPGGACPSGLSCLPFSSKNYCGVGSGSTGGKCGNKKVESGEACDGPDLNNKTCQSYGYSGGTLGCKNNCTNDFSLCTGGAKKKYGAPCLVAANCEAGLNCIKISPTATNGFCSAPCTQGVPCPSSPPGGTCILASANGNFCGWRCTDSSNCPNNMDCVTITGGKACSPK